MLLKRIAERKTGIGVRGPYRMENPYRMKCGDEKTYVTWRVERVDFGQRDRRGKAKVIAREHYATEEEAREHVRP